MRKSNHLAGQTQALQVAKMNDSNLLDESVPELR